MLTVFHHPASRSARVVWLCEEMGVPYQARAASITRPSPEFLAINPLATLPAFQDGDVRMTESVAIMLYIMGKYGPTPLGLEPGDEGYAEYLQYLIFGEASLANYAGAVVAARFRAPEADKMSWPVRDCIERFVRRADIVGNHLASAPYMAGGRFTAADISVGYALGLAELIGAGEAISPRVKDYLARLKERPAYQRAMAAS